MYQFLWYASIGQLSKLALDWVLRFRPKWSNRTLWARRNIERVAVVLRPIPDQKSNAMPWFRRTNVIASDLCVAPMLGNANAIAIGHGMMAECDACDRKAFPVMCVKYSTIGTWRPLATIDLNDVTQRECKQNIKKIIRTNVDSIDSIIPRNPLMPNDSISVYTNRRE